MTGSVTWCFGSAQPIQALRSIGLQPSTCSPQRECRHGQCPYCTAPVLITGVPRFHAKSWGAAANARPQPVPSPPVTTTVAAAPPPAPVALPPPAPSVASASPYASLEGKWLGHHRGLTVSADGTTELEDTR